MHPDILQVIAKDRTREIERAASRARLRRRERPAPLVEAVALRLDRVHDRQALVALADLEGRRLPEGPFVVGEVGGSIVAALPLDGSAALADPFRPTVEIVGLLELRAAQLASAWPGPEAPRRGLRWIANRG